MTVAVRIGALVLAVGLVLGALAVRNGRDGGDGGLGPVLDDDAPLAAGCPTELEDLCRAVVASGDVRWDVARAQATAAALGDGTLGAALLPAAWADVVDDARGRAGEAALVRSDVVARTPLLLVAFEDRATVLAGACGVAVEALDWACVGEHAGSRWADLGGDVRWGSVVPGHLPPTDATGLLATAGVIGARTGTPFSLADLRDVGFTSWFGRLERSVGTFRPPGGSHLSAMVTRGPSAANVAGATEAEIVVRDLDTAFGRIVVAAPEPLHELELVVAGTDRAAVETLVDRIEVGALADLGWRTTDAPPAGAPLATLPAVTPRPDGGVLTAVQTVWDDIAG